MSQEQAPHRRLTVVSPTRRQAREYASEAGLRPGEFRIALGKEAVRGMGQNDRAVVIVDDGPAGWLTEVSEYLASARVHVEYASLDVMKGVQR
jgi:hypothetical protein